MTVIRFFGENVENRVFSTSWKCVLCAYFVCPNVGLMGFTANGPEKIQPKSRKVRKIIGIAE